ncbi:MAG: RrF2 family transcriptional regulator [Bacillota bacterium]|jgi:Rrf2 family cysteine metabolism transcriptional repressor
MNISTKGRYGLRAVLDLAQQKEGKPVPLSSISAKQHISEGYLEQIMRPLKKTGLVSSVRGAKGGYLLAKDPKDILVSEVIFALEGPFNVVSCTNDKFNRHCQLEEGCFSKKLWGELQEAIEGVLNSYSLADLLDD